MSVRILSRWDILRAQLLRDWFAQSPFYAGHPLDLRHVAFGADGKRELRDTSGRLCCVMAPGEVAKVSGGTPS